MPSEYVKEGLRKKKKNDWDFFSSAVVSWTPYFGGTSLSLVKPYIWLL